MMRRSLPDVVAEYDVKKAALDNAFKAFQEAGGELKMAATIGGTFGQVNICTGRVYESVLHEHLLKSAWLHIYDGCNIKMLSSPREQKLFEQALSKPAPFTLENIRATFGRFLLNPRVSMLRALAEVFCGLDPAYKSHDKVKIGVAGLPKRVVMHGFSRYSTYGRDHVMTILNALAVYQGKPPVSWREVNLLMDDEKALEVARTLPPEPGKTEPVEVPARGIRLRTFQNGNGHLFFNPDTLKDINRALAEYYGDVLPDTTDEKPDKPRTGTAVSKDLQFYWTSNDTIERAMNHHNIKRGERWLEPSCGDGRMMDYLRNKGAIAFGFEVDHGRWMQCRAKGHAALCTNFLDTAVEPTFDGVLMNPPFYGKHYAKHVRHAIKFLKPGGILIAILPITARYDHGLLDDLATSRYNENWSDLPVGSFSESGTNINTTVLTYHKPRETTHD
jgi:SAM-dependent methyltransferase